MGLFRKTKFDLGECQNISFIIREGSRCFPSVIRESKIDKIELSATLEQIRNNPSKISKQSWNELIRVVYLLVERCNKKQTTDQTIVRIKTIGNKTTETLLKVYRNVVENPANINEILDSDKLFELSDKEKMFIEERERKIEKEREKQKKREDKERMEKEWADLNTTVTIKELMCRYMWFYRDYDHFDEFSTEFLTTSYMLWMDKLCEDKSIDYTIYNDVNKFCWLMKLSHQKLKQFPYPCSAVSEKGKAFRNAMDRYLGQQNESSIQLLRNSFEELYSTIKANWQSAPSKRSRS